MTRHIRATKKGISPVIATVILVAVAITVSVSVAYWMGGISSLYTTLEKVEIQSATVSKGANSYAVTLSIRNTGSKDATIDSILLNQKPMSQYSTPALNVTYNPNASVVSGGSCTVVVGIGSISVPPFTPGTTIEVKLHTAAGKEYPQMVTLT